MAWMIDINDIWWPKHIIIFDPISLLVLSVIFFFILYFFVLYKYLNKKNKIISLPKKISIKEKYSSYLKNIEKDISKLSKSDFYSSINIIFRSYLEDTWYLQSKNMTFKELQKKLDKKWLNYINKSYFLEYNKYWHDSLEIRQNLINDLTSILKN